MYLSYNSLNYSPYSLCAVIVLSFLQMRADSVDFSAVNHSMMFCFSDGEVTRECSEPRGSGKE